MRVDPLQLRQKPHFDLVAESFLPASSSVSLDILDHGIAHPMAKASTAGIHNFLVDVFNQFERFAQWFFLRAPHTPILRRQVAVRHVFVSSLFIHLRACTIPDFDSLTRFQRRSGFPGRCAQGNSGSVALQRKM